MTAPVRVLLSARLGPPTDTDRRIERHARPGSTEPGGTEPGSTEPSSTELGATELHGAQLGDHEAIRRNGAGANIIILGAVEPFDRAALESLPALQAVVRRGVGVDNVDVDAATDLGILVANVPDASVDEVAEHALTLLLALERRVGVLDRNVRAGQWRDDPVSLQRVRVGARRLSTLTLGIVGFGRIGRALARRATALYGRVLATDPMLALASLHDGVTVTSFAETLGAADHLSLHLPFSASARHLIGADELALMPPGAVLVNTARGGIVDEGAVLDALRSGRLAGAGLDVTDHEPPRPDDPMLANTDGLLLTGHSAAWSATAVTNLTEGSVRAVIDLLEGRLPSSVVNPTVLTSPLLRIPALRPHAETTDPTRAPRATTAPR